jgi:hypothetical protein
MKTLIKTALGVGLTAGMLAATAVSASAAIVCSGRTCWHTHESYDYPRSARVVVHEDNWHWGHRSHYVFREHEGRGYWRGGTWIGW